MREDVMRNSWRGLAAIIVTVLAAVSFQSHDAQTQGASCFAATIPGNVQGQDNGSSCAFLGIPYAAPPLTELRWKPPQPVAPWSPITRMAITPPPNCLQVNPPGSATVTGMEDCLRLNIWTPDPAPASPAPVIFWIHTGAFVAAGANNAAHNGRLMAERTGTIVVAANYRLGPMGFLAHPALTGENPGYSSSGNYGLLDQRAALAWVRDNIAAFGGDPDNITIAGQSAGGHSVSLHLVSPGSGGMFQRAIMQSGYASSLWPTLSESESVGASLAAAVGCTNPSEVLACLRAKPRNDIMLALPTGQQQWAETPRASWGPVVDGLEIPDQPRRLYEDGTFNRVPLIIGATRDEGWIYADRSYPSGLTESEYHNAVSSEFGDAEAPAILARYPAASFRSPKHALSQIAGDVEAVCEVRRVARLVSRTGTRVYMYSFEREVAAVAGDQVIHGIDPNFMFGNNFVMPIVYALNPEERALSNSIMDYWTRFAATGDPNGGESLKWHPVRAPQGIGDGAARYLILDLPFRKGVRLRQEQCEFWDQQFLRSIVGSLPAGK
jgi:para-nitrobenzyl esterase